MTKILNFSVVKNAPLVRVWIRTNDPRRPLICKWVNGDGDASEMFDAPSPLLSYPRCA